MQLGNPTKTSKKKFFMQHHLETAPSYAKHSDYPYSKKTLTDSFKRALTSRVESQNSQNDLTSCSQSGTFP